MLNISGVQGGNNFTNTTQIQSNKNLQWLTYIDPENRFTLKYPSFIKIVPRENRFDTDDLTFSNENSSIRGYLSHTTLDSPIKDSMGLKKLVDATNSIIKANLKSSRILDSNETALGGNLAISQIVYEQTLDGNEYGTWTVFSVVDNNIYQFGFISTPNEFDKGLPFVQQMLNSVVFSSSSTKKTPSSMQENATGNLSQFIPDNKSSEDQKSNIPANIKLSSTNSYVDSLGTYHIVGEVENISPIVVKFVKVIATLYDSNNGVVGTDFTYTNPSDIGPGSKAPFEILVMSASVPTQQIDHYRIVATYG